MQKVLKVYADAAKQKAIAADSKVLAPYDSFLLVEASDKEAKKLAKKHLVEDVSDQYQLDVGGKEVSLANAKSSGNTKGASVKALPTVKAPDGRPHHYLVQFIGPIKKEWLAGVRRAGGKPRELYAGFTYVVKADGKGAQAIGELSYVRWLGHLPYEDRIATAATANIGRKRDETGSTLPRTRILPGI